MNKHILKKTVVINMILIACVGALHTVAVAAMIYHQPIESHRELTIDTINIDVLEMQFFGDSKESLAETMVEETVPHVTEVVEEKALEVQKNTIAVKTHDEADIMLSKKIEVVKAKQIKQENLPVKKSVVQVNKPQPKVNNQNIANQTTVQKLKGGKPLVSSSNLKFIKNPTPQRPRIAHRNKWTGNSIVIVEIDQRGNPVKVVLERSSGHDVLDKAAIEAARGVKIHPYIEHGQTIAIRHRIDYAF